MKKRAPRRKEHTPLSGLVSQNRRYEALLSSTTDYVFTVLVADGRPMATAHDPGCVGVTGYTPAEYEAAPYLWYEMVHPEDRDQVTRQAAKVLQGDTVPPLEHRIIHKDGSVRWVKNTLVARKNEQGAVIAYDGLISDITERKRAEGRLATQYAVTSLLAEPATLDEVTPRIMQAVCDHLGWDMGVLWRIAPGAEVLRCGALWRRPSLPPSEFETVTRRSEYARGAGLPGRIWATGQPVWVANIAEENLFPRGMEALKAGLRGAFGFPITLGSAILGVIEFYSREIQPPDEKVARMMSTIGSQIGQFIERKRTEDALAQERNLLRTLIDALPDAIYVKDTESRFLIGNIGVAQLMGAAHPEELTGKRDYDFYPAALADQYYADERRILETGQPLINREEPAIDPAGRHHWLLTTKVPLRDSAGRIVGLVGIGRDITQRKESEEQLTQANAEMARSEEALRAALADVKRSHQELKAAQLQLIQTAKLESVGTLAAGVAHEVKNPLQIILMGIDYLSKNVPSTPDHILPVLEDMRQAISRADRIVRGLLEFSAAYRPEVNDEDLNAIIESSLALVRFELARAHVNVVKLLGDDLPRLRLDKTKIQQVFINVIVNAIHSMPDGGTLTIGTYVRRLTDIGHDVGDRTIGHFRVGDTVDFQVGEIAVVAEVEDTGRGIPESQLASIFDPFFTTKGAGQGTGLGLTVVKKIIEMHGGSIDIRNRPEGGVVVTIVFKTWRTT